MNQNNNIQKTNKSDSEPQIIIPAFVTKESLNKENNLPTKDINLNNYSKLDTINKPNIIIPNTSNRGGMVGNSNITISDYNMDIQIEHQRPIYYDNHNHKTIFKDNRKKYQMFNDSSTKNNNFQGNKNNFIIKKIKQNINTDTNSNLSQAPIKINNNKTFNVVNNNKFYSNKKNVFHNNEGISNNHNSYINPFNKHYSFIPDTRKGSFDNLTKNNYNNRNALDNQLFNENNILQNILNQNNIFFNNNNNNNSITNYFKDSFIRQNGNVIQTDTLNNYVQYSSNMINNHAKSNNNSYKNDIDNNTKKIQANNQSIHTNSRNLKNSNNKNNESFNNNHNKNTINNPYNNPNKNTINNPNNNPNKNTINNPNNNHINNHKPSNIDNNIAKKTYISCVCLEEPKEQKKILTSLIMCNTCSNYQHKNCIGEAQKMKFYECHECQFIKMDYFFTNPRSLMKKIFVKNDSKEIFSNGFEFNLQNINLKKEYNLNKSKNKNSILIVFRSLRFDSRGFEHHWPFNFFVSFNSDKCKKEHILIGAPRAKTRVDFPLFFYFDKNDAEKIRKNHFVPQDNLFNFLDVFNDKSNILNIKIDFSANLKDKFSYYFSLDVVDYIENISEVINLLPNYDSESVILKKVLMKEAEKEEEDLSNNMNNINKVKSKSNKSLNYDIIFSREKISFLDVYTSTKRIEFPGRSSNCRHFSVFDIKNYFIYSRKKQYSECPICKVKCVDLYLDKVIEKVMQQNIDKTEVWVDENYEFIFDDNHFMKTEISKFGIENRTLENVMNNIKILPCLDKTISSGFADNYFQTDNNDKIICLLEEENERIDNNHPYENNISIQNNDSKIQNIRINSDENYMMNYVNQKESN